MPLIESKADEDNDNDDDQINLANKVNNLDLMEGIKYVQQNGIDDIITLNSTLISPKNYPIS